MTIESVGALTKLASLQAVGLVFDEVAVNTSMLQELPPKRKIPAVLKVMAGSLSIKMAVIPASLLITAFAPGFIPLLLVFGGFHLAAEGLKSLLEKHDDKNSNPVPQQTEKELEKNTIRKVLIIDGLLSVEVAVMTLPIITGAAPLVAAGALAATGVIRTGWMYSLIGGIISMPRMGEWLSGRKGESLLPKAARGLGKAMNKANPYIIKGFRVAGTAALLIIGGGLVLHGFPAAAHLLEAGIASVTSHGFATGLLAHAAYGVVGMVAGGVAAPVLDRLYEGVGKAIKTIVIKPFKHVFGRKKKGTEPKAAPVNDNIVPSACALQNVPSLTNALNEAAQKPANDDLPASIKPPLHKPGNP